MKTTSETAVFGAGCFWCTETLFSRLKGVISVTPGYAGGTKENPTYEEVCEGTTGHAEVSRIVFDPKIISYDKLLEVFWHVHDPTSLNRQGADVGRQYRSLILYTSEEQKQQAQASLKKLEKAKIFGQKIVTEIKPLDKFYEAESYHHDYYLKNESGPYCRLVINPKLESFSQKFGPLLK